MIAFVQAAEFEISGGTTQLSFGGSNEHKKETLTQTFKVKNNIPTTDTISLRALTKIVSAKNDFRDTNVLISASPDTIAGGQESTITVTVKPEDFDIVDTDLKKRGIVEIATLAIEAEKINTSENNAVLGKVTTTPITLKLELKNDLDLISVEYQREEGSFSSISADSTITITVDEDIDLKFKVKNTFESSSGIEFENINIKIESTDLDIEKTTTISEILAGAQAEKTTTVSADDTGSGEVKVSVTGDDKFGGKHGEVFIFNFNVEEAEEEEEEPVDENDADGDGVPDNRDECLNTVSVCDVDAVGCPVDSDTDGTCDALDPTPRPVTRQSNDEIDTSSGNEDAEVEDATTKVKKTTDDEESTSGFIPFLIGFAVGILVTAGFSVLIKS